MVGVGKAVGIRILSPPEVAQDHTWCDPGTDRAWCCPVSHTFNPCSAGISSVSQFPVDQSSRAALWMAAEQGGSWGWPRKWPTGALGQRKALTGLEVGQLLPHQAGLTL